MAEESNEDRKTRILRLRMNMRRIMEDANKTSVHSSAFRMPSRNPDKNPVSARTSASAASSASASKKETYKERQTRIRKEKKNTRAARANSRNRVKGIRYKPSATRKIIKK
jgi:hypothetical protein